MSDISIEFTWAQLALIVLIIGWPGLVFGAVGGGLLWRRHPAPGVVVGALLGLTLWTGIRILLR